MFGGANIEEGATLGLSCCRPEAPGSAHCRHLPKSPCLTSRLPCSCLAKYWGGTSKRPEQQGLKQAGEFLSEAIQTSLRRAAACPEELMFRV